MKERVRIFFKSIKVTQLTHKGSKKGVNVPISRMGK